MSPGGYHAFVAKLDQPHVLTAAMLVGLLGKRTLPLPLCTLLLLGTLRWPQLSRCPREWGLSWEQGLVPGQEVSDPVL